MKKNKEQKQTKVDIEDKHISNTIKKRKPLERHKLIVKDLSGNIGKGKKRKSLKQTMIDKGYSESYADSGHIKKTRSWDELMKVVLNDEMLAEKHEALLNAKQVQRFIFATRIKDEDIIEMVEEAGFKVITIRNSPMGKMAFYSVDNTRAIKDGLDMAYKLKAKFTPEEINLKFKGFNKSQLIDLVMSKVAPKKK